MKFVGIIEKLQKIMNNDLAIMNIFPQFIHDSGDIIRNFVGLFNKTPKDLPMWATPMENLPQVFRCPHTEATVGATVDNNEVKSLILPSSNSLQTSSNNLPPSSDIGYKHALLLTQLQDDAKEYVSPSDIGLSPSDIGLSTVDIGYKHALLLTQLQDDAKEYVSPSNNSVLPSNPVLLPSNEIGYKHALLLAQLHQVDEVPA